MGGMNMKEFDTFIERKGTDSVKWNALKTIYGTDDLLPMWVADMDFASPPEVIEALEARARHGVFGYGQASPDVFQAVKNWVHKRYQWDLEEKWLLPSPGVVTALGFAIQALTAEGDKILIQTPVYHPFYHMIENNHRIVVKNPLLLHNGKYEIDFADFEAKLKSGVKLFIICNPHNPVGRVWRREELEKLGDLCHKYGVKIVSDEIHADIIYKPNQHIPIASLSSNLQELTITCIAPSKTFNIPGLQASLMIIPNAELRKKVQTVQERISFHGLNIFGRVALEAAYKYGEAWLENLLTYLQDNRDYALQFIEQEIPSVKAISPEGTYLLWIDCRSLGLSDNDLKKLLVEKGKLALEPGGKYGVEGEGFVRMNIGCPRSLLEDGLGRLKKALS